MIRINQVKLPENHDLTQIKVKASQILKCNVNDIKELHIIKQSIDARKKPDIFYSYVVDIAVDGEEKVMKRIKNPNVVLGAGIGFDVLLSKSGAATLEGYSSFAAFCALDTYGTIAAGQTVTDISKQLLFCFEKYPLRVLVESYSDSGFKAVCSALNELGIYNIQHHKIASSS